jgi:hypothetical protein
MRDSGKEAIFRSQLPPVEFIDTVRVAYRVGADAQDSPRNESL